MKSLIARWIGSELFTWTSVLAITILYANWLWHCDTRSTHRLVKGWAGRVIACLPGGNDRSPPRIHEAATQKAHVAKSITLDRLRDLPAHGITETHRAPTPIPAPADSNVRLAGSERPQPPPARGELRQTHFQGMHQPSEASPGSRPTHFGRPSQPADRDGSATAAFEEGMRWFQNGDYRQAEQAFQAAAAYGPDDARYRYFLALSQYFSGQRGAAEPSLAEAVRLETIRPVPNLGRLLERVQGPVRNWLEAARRNAQVGPYARD